MRDGLPRRFARAIARSRILGGVLAPLARLGALRGGARIGMLGERFLVVRGGADLRAYALERRSRAGRAGWVSRVPGRLTVPFLLPTGGTGAEIGVWRGDYSAYLLAEAKPVRLHLVDPWRAAPEGGWAVHPGGNRDAAEMESIYRSVVRRFADRPEVSIHRTTSSAFFAELPAGSLDWCYIDGDHAHDAVTEDLEGAWRAVRPGGIVAGNDYSRFWPTVVEAVDAFCAGRGVEPVIEGDTEFIIHR